MFLDDKNTPLVSYYLYTSAQGADNRAERERMRRVLMRAIKYELTERQRVCLTMHYLEGMKMKDIAHKLNLSKSTVSRHIAAATMRLKNIARYYER